MKELIDIQSQLKAPKGQYNLFGKYKFRSCEDILEAVKPILKEHGCLLTISDDIVLIGTRIYVKATATLKNSAGETVVITAFAREEDAKKGMDGSQVTGASSSYARKYALNGMFCIDDTKDSDSTNTGEAKTPAKNPITQAVAEINAAQSRKELTEVWNKYQSLQSDKTFSSAMIEASKKYPKC